MMELEETGLVLTSTSWLKIKNVIKFEFFITMLTTLFYSLIYSIVIY